MTVTSNDISQELRSISLMKNRIDQTLLDIEDKERTYEWMFLYIVTKFENFLEEYFLWILIWSIQSKKWSKIRKIWLVNFSKKVSKADVTNFLLWDKQLKWGYLDWLPYDRTEVRAKRFFVDWHPFNIDQSEKNLLNQITKIRNFIAHKSDDSLDKLTKEIASYHNIYDLFNGNHSWKNTYFDYLILELNSICLKIKKDLI